MEVSLECPRCGYRREDNMHIFFQCPVAVQIWSASPVGLMDFVDRIEGCASWLATITVVLIKEQGKYIAIVL